MLDPPNFARYLAAKRALDSRSINPRVQNTLAQSVSDTLHVLDVGCGSGGTLDRFLDANLFLRDGSTQGHYTGVDRDPALTALARANLPLLAERHGLVLESAAESDRLVGNQGFINIRFETDDVFSFARRALGRQTWTCLTAHAFLDLFDLDLALDTLIPLLEPEGLIHCTLNFDDVTAIEPPIDPEIDDLILSIYHESMYASRWGGSGGQPRTGRRLFHAFTRRGVAVLDMGPSDWVITPHAGEYRDGDRIVLEFLLAHIGDVVGASGSVQSTRLNNWLAARKRHIETAQLVYIAHQLDVVGRTTPPLQSSTAWSASVK